MADIFKGYKEKYGIDKAEINRYKQFILLLTSDWYYKAIMDMVNSLPEDEGDELIISQYRGLIETDLKEKGMI